LTVADSLSQHFAGPAFMEDALMEDALKNYTIRASFSVRVEKYVEASEKRLN
jgi:acyl-CoA hydrolase